MFVRVSSPAHRETIGEQNEFDGSGVSISTEGDLRRPREDYF